MNNSKYLTAVEGTKLLPTTVMDIIKLYKENKDKEVHPLVRAVANFDRSYSFSDSGTVWKNGVAREKELMVEIDASLFSPEQKKTLLTGLTLYGYDTLEEAFPELNNKLPSSLTDLYEELENDTYDEDRILNTISNVNKLIGIFNNTSIQSYSDLLVKTPSTNRYSREDLVNFKKVCLSKVSNDLFKELVPKITKSDIEYVSKLKGALSPYINVGTENSRNYQRASLVPDFEVFVRFTTIDDIEVMKISSSKHNWNIVSIL